jgi:hypothetical protein
MIFQGRASFGGVDFRDIVIFARAEFRGETDYQAARLNMAIQSEWKVLAGKTTCKKMVFY